MTKISLMMLCVAAVSVGACSNKDANNLPPPGHYERTTSHTTPSGTSVERQNTTDVTVDRYGNRRAVIENTTTTDPPGLFNSTTSTSTRVVNER